MVPFFFLDRLLTKGQNALVELQTQRPVALELYKDFKELGRFMLRYSGSTVAAGVVTEVSQSGRLAVLGHGVFFHCVQWLLRFHGLRGTQLWY